MIGYKNKGTYSWSIASDKLQMKKYALKFDQFITKGKILIFL